MEEPEYRAMYDVEKTHWWFVSRRIFIDTLLRVSGCITFLSGVARVRKIRIADIGAGTGGMIPYLERYGAVTGIEPSVCGRKLAKKRGIILKKGFAEHTGLPAKSMDMVCFFDVLYHKGIHDSSAVSEAKRLLRPGGWLVISDCAFSWLTGPHDRAVQARERYTLAQMTRIVQSQGFVIQKKTYAYFLLLPFVTFKRMIDRLSTASTNPHSDVVKVHWLINTVLLWLCRLEALGLPFGSYPFGSSVLLVAQKKGKK